MRRLLPMLVLLIAIPQMALAHAIGLEAKLKGTTVAVEAYYDDDTPAAEATVTVEDADDKRVIAEGKTDTKGVWSFTCPAPGNYIVRIDAGGGHAAKTTITIPSPATALSPPEDGAPVRESPSVSLSDGPSRETFTGPMRWAMAGIGLVAIGGLTILLRVFIRGFRHSREQT